MPRAGKETFIASVNVYLETTSGVGTTEEQSADLLQKNHHAQKLAKKAQLGEKHSYDKYPIWQVFK